MTQKNNCTRRFGLILPAIMLTTGCGTIPDYVEDTAREAIKAEIEEKVQELIDQLTAELLGQFDLDLTELLEIQAQDDKESDR